MDRDKDMTWDGGWDWDWDWTKDWDWDWDWDWACAMHGERVPALSLLPPTPRPAALRIDKLPMRDVRNKLLMRDVRSKNFGCDAEQGVRSFLIPERSEPSLAWPSASQQRRREAIQIN